MALEDSALFSKIYGGLIGAAVGDALGGPVEGLDYPEIERLYGRVERMLPYDKAPSEHGQFTNEAGSYTDDTRISLIHCQAILATGGDVTRGDLARAITDYHYQNPGRLERAFIEEYHLKGFYGARKLLYGGQPTNGAIIGNAPSVCCTRPTPGLPSRSPLNSPTSLTAMPSSRLRSRRRPWRGRCVLGPPRRA